MSEIILFDTCTLRIGDMWPQWWMRHHGTIIEIRSCDHTEIRLAVFADGATVSIGGYIPAPADFVAQLQSTAGQQHTAVPLARP